MPLHWLPPRRYHIPAQQVATAKGAHGAAHGWVYACTDGVHTGWGDVPDAVALRNGGQHRAQVQAFAEDIAQLHLEAQQNGVSLGAWLHAEFPDWTVPPRATVRVQALVDFAQLQADPRQHRLRDLGITHLKLKLVGNEPVELLHRILTSARRHGWTLRVDVNGAWQARSDLHKLLATCAHAGVAYVEDPVPVTQLPLTSPVALAVDAIDSSVADALHAAHDGRAQVVVVKPPLWGNVARFLADSAALHAVGIGVVLSSSFEGPIGLMHLAQLASVLPSDAPAGIATHLLWPHAWQPTQLEVVDGALHRAHWPLALPHDPVALVAMQPQATPILQGAWDRQTSALAAKLRSLGVQPGTRVATWAGNTPEALLAWHATRRCSATWVPLHPRLTAVEAQRLLDRTKPVVLLADAAQLREVQLENLHVIDLKSIGTLPDAMPTPAEAAYDAAAALLFTSGSTGDAKGVVLSSRALRAAADAAYGQFGAQSGQTWLCCLPVCHVSGLLIQARAARLGMAVLLLDQPTTAALADAFQQMQPRIASLVPTQLTRLLDDGVPPPPELLAVIVGGAPCPPDLVDRARAAGWPVLPSYGMTETAAQVATAPLETRLDTTPWPRADDAVCVGPPIPGVELRIEAGEILVKSAQILDAYLDAPAAIVDGWLHTGDLGRLDARGWLWVTGRRGELILRAGENVTPDEVEAVLLRIPGVLETCVVGVPHRVLGQRVAAWLTVDAPVRQDVLDAALQALAPFKRPDVWLQTRLPLPRTGPGKVARGEVRKQLAQVTTP